MDILPVLNKMATPLPVEEKEKLKQQLAHYLNSLLLHDFAALVQLLYRVDVSENKVKTILSKNPQTNAGKLIADLLIERQQEKVASQKNFRPPGYIPEEEKW